MMMGMAPWIGNAPDPTAVTAMAVVVVDDCVSTVTPMPEAMAT